MEILSVFEKENYKEVSPFSDFAGLQFFKNKKVSIWLAVLIMSMFSL